MMILFVGCGNAKTFKAYTFNVETGNSIKVKLNTSDVYNLATEVLFKISQDGDIKSQGTFIFGEAYEQYKDVVDTYANAELLDAGNKDEIMFPKSQQKSVLTD